MKATKSIEPRKTVLSKAEQKRSNAELSEFNVCMFRKKTKKTLNKCYFRLKSSSSFSC